MARILFTRALARYLAAPYAEAAGATVSEALAATLASRSTLRGHMLDDQGAPLRHINIYVNNRPVTDRAGLTDPVGPGDEIRVVQALPGGWRPASEADEASSP